MVSNRQVLGSVYQVSFETDKKCASILTDGQMQLLSIMVVFACLFSLQMWSYIIQNKITINACQI